MKKNTIGLGNVTTRKVLTCFIYGITLPLWRHLKIKLSIGQKNLCETFGYFKCSYYFPLPDLGKIILNLQCFIFVLLIIVCVVDI